MVVMDLGNVYICDDKLVSEEEQERIRNDLKELLNRFLIKEMEDETA